MNRPREPRFSERYGHSRGPAEIRAREDAPYELRRAVMAIAQDAGLNVNEIREVVCRALRTVPNPQNWSRENVTQEVLEYLDSCDWFKVYDIIEAIHGNLSSMFGSDDESVQQFEDEMNAFVRERGIAWQLVDGRIEVRGEESFESTVRGAVTALDETDRQTASGEFHEALIDLSRRPDPDLTGAITHAVAGLECVMRDVTGDPRATLGDLIGRYAGMIPRPLDTAVEKAWGYASEMGRHVREGRAPEREEAELVVSVAAAVATYLARKGEQAS